MSSLDELPRSRVGLLAARGRLRDLVLYAAARNGGPALLADVHPDDALQGAVLIVDAERGFERPARLALINATRTPMPRLAVVLVYCEPADQELLSIVEQEVKQELALLGFSTEPPQLTMFRVVNASRSLHSQLVPASAAALFSDLRSWQASVATSAGPGDAPRPPSIDLTAERAVLAAIWQLARRSTILQPVRLPDEEATATFNAFFDQFPAGGECCGKPRRRRIGLDFRRMLHDPPPQLGACAVYQCVESFGHGDSQPYVVHHLPPSALGPPHLAACTGPRSTASYAPDWPPTILAPAAASWVCACPEEFDDHWDDPDVARLTAALRAWAAATGLPIDDDEPAGYPIDLLEPVIEALGLETPIGERSGGPIRTQSGGWRSYCHCKREFHLLLQTQAFTGDYTTILWGCPDHPEDADLFTIRL